MQLFPLSEEYQCGNREKIASLKCSVLPDTLFSYSHVQLPIWQDADAELSVTDSCIKLNTCQRVLVWRKVYFKNIYSEEASTLWTTEILHLINLSVVVMAVKYSPPIRISRQWNLAKRCLSAAHSSQTSLWQHTAESEELSPAFSSVGFADSDDNGSFTISPLGSPRFWRLLSSSLPLTVKWDKVGGYRMIWFSYQSIASKVCARVIWPESHCCVGGTDRVPNSRCLLKILMIWAVEWIPRSLNSADSSFWK